MRKVVFLVSAIVMLLGYSASASSNVLEGQLVRQTLLENDVKALMSTSEEGQSLPLRIVYQSEAQNTMQVFDPTQENLVIVKDVKVEVIDDMLTATVQLNVNGKQGVSRVFVKSNVKAPWTLSAL
ncbi:hypothetical protein [uncultured Acetobacteroides sp.]|uniref:hypothetical protein n=1 Tax=uncultured Acetobacteroides sp. TaxID=1760811 RepID=UPI0029F4AD4C|nr:hypothetical protein [uncultured Acetobacteroides sp.]